MTSSLRPAGVNRAEPDSPTQSNSARRTRLGGRAVAAVTDQAASSLTNYVVLFAALRSLPVGELGLFTFIYTMALLAITVVRALALEPLTIRFASADSRSLERATRAAAGASLALGIGFLALCGLGAALVGGSLRWPIVALGAALPPLLVQDAWRMHLFASQRPWAAAVNDGTCLVVTVIATAVLLGVVSRPGISMLLLCWAIGSSAGVLLGVGQTRMLPRLWRARAWVTNHRDLGVPLAVERGAESFAAALSLLLVGVLVSSVALGEIGAARALMGPVTTLTTSIVMFGLPEAARLRDRRKALNQFTASMSGVTVTAVGLFTVAMFFAPDWLGHALAGDNWTTAKTLLIPVALWTACSGARSGPSTGLRVLERARTLRKLSIMTGTVVLVASVVGSMTSGAAGAAWAFGVTYVGAVVVYWSAFLCVRKQPRASAPTVRPAPL